ncbi:MULTISPECIES: hypothetical protein [Gilvimarinus]|uniref:hypothetical protein n=1 Tax=Gilvimarinus TaxID=940550 RepID=UPI0003609686|nr:MULTISPECIES: hypothetical protein [Gilvimarinus]UTF61241.1 hypothetical protein NHM04_05425 [Gilvimarinus sp. DA14]
MNMTTSILLSTLLTTTLAAQAHDPKEHKKDAENPDCSEMKNMDHSKMDMDDPVMKAMMKKCKKDMHHDNENNESDSDHAHDDNQNKDEHAEHKH